MRYFDRVDTLKISNKSRNDFVTDVDRAAEVAIIQEIRGKFPQHAILAEESGAHGGNDFEWVIDPLDGTKEFVAGRPEYTVNIALVEEGEPILGVIQVPVSGRLYLAARGVAARRVDGGSETPLRPAAVDRPRLDEAVEAE